MDYERPERFGRSQSDRLPRPPAGMQRDAAGARGHDGGPGRGAGRRGAAPDVVAGGEPTILMVPRDRCCDTPETCRELCGRGDPSACVAYGEMLVFANNRDTAVTPLATACDAHIASACTTLAAQLFFLDRMDEAFDVLRPLCAAGLPDECALFGELLGRAGRPDEALGPWSTACVADIGAACAGLGDALEARGTRGDADAVAGVLRPRCERNNDDACTSLGGLLAAAGGADESLGRYAWSASDPPTAPWATCSSKRAARRGRRAPRAPAGLCAATRSCAYRRIAGRTAGCAAGPDRLGPDETGSDPTRETVRGFVG